MSAATDLADSIDTLEDVTSEADVYAAVLAAGTDALQPVWAARLEALAARLEAIAAELVAAQ